MIFVLSINIIIELMKLARTEILKFAFEGRPYTFKIERADLASDPYLIGIKDASGEIHFDDIGDDKISAHVISKGMMICPCAMTLEEVYVPYAIDEEVYLCQTDTDDDAYILTDELDIEDFILSLVLPNAPIKVVKDGEIEYPIGDGWRVLSEEMFKELHSNEIDPRLAKLKEYKFEEEE